MRDRTVDVVVMLESAFVFAADLMRSISGRVVCHFVRAEIRDIQFGGHDRREIYFSRPPRLEDRDVLVVDAVMQSGSDAGFSAEAAAGEPSALAALGGACSTSPRNGGWT